MRSLKDQLPAAGRTRLVHDDCVDAFGLAVLIAYLVWERANSSIGFDYFLLTFKWSVVTLKRSAEVTQRHCNRHDRFDLDEPSATGLAACAALADLGSFDFVTA